MADVSAGTVFAVFGSLLLLASPLEGGAEDVDTRPPTVEALGGDWLPTTNNGRDMPTVTNFWGSVGTHAQGTDPTDVFSINALTLPPWAGCGASGCGRIRINGDVVMANSTRWTAYDAGRRGWANGLDVETHTRMAFESNVVLWNVSLTKTSDDAGTDVSVELTGLVQQESSLGWVFPLPANPADFRFSVGNVGPQQQQGMWAEHLRSPAKSLFVFGGLQPTSWSNGTSPCPPPPCRINDTWTQLASGQVFGPIRQTDNTFAWNNTKYPGNGWDYFNGTITHTGSKQAIDLSYHRVNHCPKGQPTCYVQMSGEFETCNRLRLTDSEWVRTTAMSQLPQATFVLPSDMAIGQTVTLQVVLAVGNATDRVLADATVTASQFVAQFDAAASLWENRWQSAFNKSHEHFSGHLPTLSLEGPSAADATRVFYMSCLTVVALERTNLPIVFPRVFVTATGNAFFHNTKNGIGGTRQWFWDAALHANLNSLLDPVGLRTDLRAVLEFDFHTGNGISLDSCQPPPPGTKAPVPHFYAFNPWAYYLSLSTYLKVTNDTSFLHEPIDTPLVKNTTLSEYFEIVALDWLNYTAPGSLLSDYGPSPGNFLECVPLYIHIAPAIQANNVWMLRQTAALRKAQGRIDDATRLAKLADAVAYEMIRRMYVPQRGTFNCLRPDLSPIEMRHIIDFFSVGIGMCSEQGCDLSADMREAMVTFVERELVTATWARALSPLTAKMPYVSRPDHGTTGSYGAWPALMVEAYGLVQGNYTRALELLAAFAKNTQEGPFGQAHECPQQPHPPYTPNNTASSFKPTLGETRFTADCGGAFFDAVLRGAFGFRPPMLWAAAEGNPTEVLQAVLFMGDRDPGFRGKLAHLQTPVGLATLTATANGVKAVLEP